jgi:hypothetical protein
MALALILFITFVVAGVAVLVLILAFHALMDALR